MKEMNTSMIDTAYDFAKVMFERSGGNLHAENGKDYTDFDEYWDANYVKFCDDFANGVYENPTKSKHRKSAKKKEND